MHQVSGNGAVVADRLRHPIFDQKCRWLEICGGRTLFHRSFNIPFVRCAFGAGSQCRRRFPLYLGLSRRSRSTTVATLTVVASCPATRRRGRPTSSLVCGQVDIEDCFALAERIAAELLNLAQMGNHVTEHGLVIAPALGLGINLTDIFAERILLFLEGRIRSMNCLISASALILHSPRSGESHLHFKATPASRAYDSSLGAWFSGIIPPVPPYIAFAWDTQLSPADLRGLTVAGIKGEGKDGHFPIERAKSGRAAIGTVGERSLALLDAYLKKEPCEVGAILRNRSGAVYSRYTLPDDFGMIREMTFPGDTRTLADMRRSGAIEANAGGASPSTTAAKMANSISSANAIHKTYQPVDLESVRQADEPREIGRRRMRDQNK